MIGWFLIKAFALVFYTSLIYYYYLYYYYYYYFYYYYYYYYYYYMITCSCPYLEYHLKCKTYITPCANACNIVDQQLPTLFDVICCICLLTVLYVVESCCICLHTTAITHETFPNIVVSSLSVLDGYHITPAYHRVILGALSFAISFLCLKHIVFQEIALENVSL